MATSRRRLWQTLSSSFLSVILLALFGVFLFEQRSEIGHLGDVVHRANFFYIVLGAFLSFLYVFVQGLFYRSTFEAIGKRLPLRQAISLFLKRFFLGSFIPAGFTVSQYTFTHLLKKHAINELESHLASTIYLLVGAVTYVLILIPTLFYLVLSHHLTMTEWYASIIIILVTFLLIIEFLSLFRQKGMGYQLAKRLIPDLEAFLGSWKNRSIDRWLLFKTFVFSLLVDLIGITLLLVTLAGLNLPASLSLAIVGYVITIIVLTLSPIFQGLGLVEISLVYVLVQFGISKPDAVATTLLYRVFQLWLPLLLGFIAVIYRRIKPWIDQLPALGTFILGVMNVIYAADPPLGKRLPYLQAIFTRDFFAYSRVLVLVSGFFLILLAYNLTQKYRRAWYVALFLVTASIIGYIINGPERAELVTDGIVLLLLLASSQQYTIKNDIPTFRRAFTILIISFITTIGVGVMAFYFLNRRSFGQNFNLEASFIHIFRLYFSFGDTSLVPRTRFGDLFIGTIYGVAIFSIFYAVLAFFQPTLFALRILPEERALARKLTAQYGNSSLDYFKLYWDKVFYFDEDHTAFLAFKVVRRTAIILGDPIAPDKKTAKALITQFRSYVYDHGWRWAFQQVSDDYLDVYKSMGLKILKIGEEAEVPLAHVSLEGKHNKEFRNSVRRLEGQGYEVKFYEPTLDPGLLRRLRNVSNEWLSLPFRTERIFTQGMFDEAIIQEMPVATVEDKRGKVLAFITLIENYAPGCVTLDLLRRRREIPNGTMEFLLLKTFFHYREKGYTTFSLGLAPLSGMAQGHDADIPEKTLKFFYDNFNSLFSYKGLRDFKAKFQPVWRPKYLIYGATYNLPGIALASLQASQVGSWQSWLHHGVKQTVLKSAPKT